MWERLLITSIDYFNIGMATSIALICTVTDIRKMKIYNKHTYPAIILGVIYCLVTKQYIHLQGSLIIFFFFLLLYFAGKGKLGGGDLKLSVALSLFIGYQPIIWGTLITAFIILFWSFCSTLEKHRNIMLALFTVTGRLPGKAMPFGALLGPVSVLVACFQEYITRLI